ncbi:glycosyltransferase [Candidatus Fermentibacteria bacterium]|nr:glycosyltransferase [Candidatus Fermentibacteria bacterium]
MNVVWVSPYLPLPVTTGGRRRIGSLMARLSRRHEITLVSFDRGEDTGARDASRALVHEVHTVKRRSTKSAVNALLWAATPMPFMAVANGFHGAMVHRIRQVVRETSPHIIHCEHFHLWHTVARAREPSWPPVILSQQGVEFLVTQRFASVPGSPLLRAGLRIELQKARRWEIAACRAADAVVVVSDEDRRVLARYLPEAHLRVVENGVDAGEFCPGAAGIDPVGSLMLFVGTFSFFGNRDALAYLVSDILPSVRSVRRDAVLRVVGENPPTVEGEGVEYMGFVPSVVPHLQQARLLIAPLRTGSGTKLKLLEAMACGIPFVTTSFGAEGIVGADEAGLIADDSQGLAAATLRLLEDHDLAVRLGRRGREIVVDRYSWDASAEALEGVWESIRVMRGEGHAASD